MLFFTNNTIIHNGKSYSLVKSIGNRLETATDFVRYQQRGCLIAVAVCHFNDGHKETFYTDEVDSEAIFKFMFGRSSKGTYAYFEKQDRELKEHIAIQADIQAEREKLSPPLVAQYVQKGSSVIEEEHKQNWNLCCKGMFVMFDKDTAEDILDKALIIIERLNRGDDIDEIVTFGQQLIETDGPIRIISGHCNRGKLFVDKFYGFA
jgi:hypothetical protein